MADNGAQAGPAGMDPEIFDQFIDQLERYVRERLIPAEEQVLADDRIPDDLVDEMREMGLFGLTMPEEYGGSGMNIPQYVETIRVLSYALPAYRSITSINLGMVCSALKNSGHRRAEERVVAAPCRWRDRMLRIDRAGLRFG